MDLFKTVLSISLTKLNYPCLKLQQEACIRKQLYTALQHYMKCKAVLSRGS